MDGFVRSILCCIQLVLALIACLGADPAQAEVRIAPFDQTDAGMQGMHKIVISGPIDESTLMEFSQAMTDARIAGTAPVVELNSSGGSVYAAIAIGNYLRRSGFTTGVPRGARCDSACVLILAAGVRRSIEQGAIGIHRPYFQRKWQARATDEPMMDFDQLIDDIHAYLCSMGVEGSLLRAMLKVPSERIRILSTKEVADYRLETERHRLVEAEDGTQGDFEQGVGRSSPKSIIKYRKDTKKARAARRAAQVRIATNAKKVPTARTHGHQASNWTPRRTASHQPADGAAWSATMYFSGDR